MNAQIHFSVADKERVHRNYGETAATCLEEQIEQKNDTLEWVNTRERIHSRFQSVINQDGYCFPEMRFTAGDSEWRAIFVWIPSADRFVLYDIVQKGTNYQSSRQHDLINGISDNAEKIYMQARSRLSEQLTEANTDRLRTVHAQDL